MPFSKTSTSFSWRVGRLAWAKTPRKTIMNYKHLFGRFWWRRF